MSALRPRSLDGLTFLVASPCDFTREILLYALSAYGAEQIHESADGADAASLLRDKPVDVLLADLHMAPVDGPTLTRLVRCEEISVLRPTVIVLLCDAPTAEDVLAARDAGIDDLIRFPVSAETLHRRLQRSLLRWCRRSSRGEATPLPCSQEPLAPAWTRLASPPEHAPSRAFQGIELSADEMRALRGLDEAKLGI